MKIARRTFFKTLIAIIIGLLKLSPVSAKMPKSSESQSSGLKNASANVNIGTAEDGLSYIYKANGGSPEDNVQRALDLMGGIDKLIGQKDIVVIKPNAQWWNQGMTNTNAIKGFIEAILKGVENFSGEVIVAENHHYQDDNSRGWNTDKRNGDYNLNELVEFFQNSGYPNITNYYWHDGADSHATNLGSAKLGGLVSGPGDGDGYLWLNDLVYYSPNNNKAMMSYPIFTSSYSGITIDLKNGAWKNGEYIDDPVKLINFSSLCHHEQTGVTATIKNYLGITDMTCGYRGVEPEGFLNFHYIGVRDIHWRIRKILDKVGFSDPYEYIGGAVGFFMNNVFKADMNIIAAEYVGYGSRTDTKRRYHENGVLMSLDPVALDYYSAKHILMPITRNASDGSKYLKMNDPDNKKGVFHKFLMQTYLQGIGNIEEDKIKVIG